MEASTYETLPTLVVGGRSVTRWRTLLIAAGWAAVGSVVLTFIQVGIYLRWPPPETAEGYFLLFSDAPLLGLLSLDVLYILNNLLVLILYVGLFIQLRSTHPSAALLGLVLGSVGMAAYLASNPAFEMLSLAGAYSVADSAGRTALLGAGEALIAGFKGTAFDAYYILNAAALFLFAGPMMGSSRFSRGTAFWGLGAAVLMLVPSTVPNVGPYFALASLVPWVVFAARTGRELFRSSREVRT